MMDSKLGRRRSRTGRHIAALVAVAVAVVLAGCGSITANSDGGTGGTGGITGAGGAGGGKDLQTFIGTWTLGSGTTTLTCAGLVTTNQVTGNVVWEAGTTSDLMEAGDSTSSSGCALKANVSGNTATALPNQTCTKMGANIMISSYTFVVGSGGTTATETTGGTETVTTGGVGTACTYSETATYTKSP